MPGTSAARFLICAAVCACAGLAQSNGSLNQQAVDLLESKCAGCHGAARMSDLDVRQREMLLKGGKRGPAVAPGKPEGSLLFQAAAHLGDLKMPPGSKAPLPAAELKILRDWIEAGANWPANPQTAKKPVSTWWSFQQVRRPRIPPAASGSAPANPIDAFVNAKLAEKGLRPAPKVDKVTLIRRAYEDLIGLPPTPSQVDQFVADASPAAFEKVVDELLASPHYGERWARQWLDVVRYADSAGFEGDVYYPNAWRYRDYVIKSFNEDKPYDRFVQEQIAGDELWPDDLDLAGFYDVPPEKLEHLEARVGTGMYTLGPEIQESYLDSPKLRYERLTDWVDTTGAAFLGLTLGCARCHDHKFDPIPQADYYRMQAIFAASKPVLLPVVTGLSATHRDEYYHTQLAVVEARAAYRLLERKVRERALGDLKKQYSAEVVQAFETPADKRTTAQTATAAPLVKAASAIKVEEHFTPEERKEHDELAKKIVQTVLDVPETDPSHRVRFDGLFDLPVATVLGHVDPENVPDVYVLNRGDLGKNKAKVGPGLLSVLSGEDSALVTDEYGPRYRKALALWLTRPQHPLTARVMVNRIWQGHFGRGLVATANDFGSQGTPPSHPELLDWLASEFVARDWSLKSLHRLIVLSDAYQRTSRFTDATDANADPDNVYLWRMNRRRLDAESLWDAIHAVSGTLNLKMGGRPVIPPLTAAEMMPMRIKSWWVTPADPAEANRRAVYILARRNFTFPLFDRFDRPDSSASCPVREVTTVAPQALWGMNNRIAYEQASQFAARLTREHADQPAKQIRAAWRLALAREPSFDELQESERLLDRLASAPGGTRSDALTQLCLAVFNLSEFEYID
jgi:uncharacterized protein (DUF2267 family)